MNGFERRALQKKQDIMKSALKLYAAQGIRKVSVAQIAAHAQVSQVTLFKYFESKENLTRQVLLQIYEEELRSLITILNSDFPSAEKVEKIFLKSDMSSQYSSEFYEDVLAEPYLQLRLDHEQRLLPHLIHFIEEQRNEGVLNPNYSTDTLLFYMHLFSAGATKHVSQYPIDRKKFYRDLAQLFLYGVAARATEPTKKE